MGLFADLITEESSVCVKASRLRQGDCLFVLGHPEHLVEPCIKEIFRLEAWQNLGASPNFDQPFWN